MTVDIANLKQKTVDLDESQRDITHLKQKATDLEENFSTITEAVGYASHQPNFSSTSIHAICDELEKRQQKQKNLVVFGLKEEKSDIDLALQLANDVGSSAKIQSCFRIGQPGNSSREMARPRPLIIRFASVEDRVNIQNNLRNLKGKSQWEKVSIKSDLMKMQCAEKKKSFDKLLDEMRKRNEKLLGKGKWRLIRKGETMQLVFYKND